MLSQTKFTSNGIQINSEFAGTLHGHNKYNLQMQRSTSSPVLHSRMEMKTGLFLISAGTAHAVIWLPYFHHDNLHLAKSATHSIVSL
jgi:hypothetical protein